MGQVVKATKLITVYVYGIALQFCIDTGAEVTVIPATYIVCFRNSVGSDCNHHRRY